MATKGTNVNTPWGKAVTIDRVAEGIEFVSTPGHGGYRLSPERNAQVPAAYRAFAAKWSKGWFDGSTHSEGWYEEDCAALAVAVTFPEHFPLNDQQVTEFRNLLDGWVSE